MDPKSAEHKEDIRQINRWRRFTGDADEEWGMGRWKSRLMNMMKDKVKMQKGGFTVEQMISDKKVVSPVIRQSLQHWGYQITEHDLRNAIENGMELRDA